MKELFRPALAAALSGALLCLLAGCASGAAKGQAAEPETKQPVAHRNAADDLLLAVDFQNVYLPGYDWACPGMPEAMKNTIKLLDAPNAPDCLMTRYLPPEDPVPGFAGLF